MNQAHLYKVLTARFADTEAEEIVKEISSLENQNIERLKEVFATKTELHEMERRLSDKIDNKVNKIYWFILGQTAVLVGLLIAIVQISGKG